MLSSLCLYFNILYILSPALDTHQPTQHHNMVVMHWPTDSLSIMYSVILTEYVISINPLNNVFLWNELNSINMHN